MSYSVFISQVNKNRIIAHLSITRINRRQVCVKGTCLLNTRWQPNAGLKFSSLESYFANQMGDYPLIFGSDLYLMISIVTYIPLR